METILLNCSYERFRTGKVFRVFNYAKRWDFTMQYWYNEKDIPKSLKPNSLYLEEQNVYLTYHSHSKGKTYYNIPHLVHKEDDELFQISTVIDLPIQINLLLSMQLKGMEIINTSGGISLCTSMKINFEY